MKTLHRTSGMAGGLAAVCLAAFLGTAREARGDQTVGGNIGDATWHSGETITVAWTVNVRGTLTVEPDVRVEIAPDAEIRVIWPGALRVNGTAQAPVVFTAAIVNPAPHQYWGQIAFDPATTGTLDFALIKYAHRGVSITDASPSIRNCVIRSIQGEAGADCSEEGGPPTDGQPAYGISIQGASHPVIENNTIDGVQGGTGGGGVPDEWDEFCPPDDGAAGGESIAVRISNLSGSISFSGNSISHVTGGSGGAGGKGYGPVDYNQGHSGGPGGAATGIRMTGVSASAAIQGSQILAIQGGGGGGGGEGGSGGEHYPGGSGGPGGEGGKSAGIIAEDNSGGLVVEGNELASIAGGDGGYGGAGGTGYGGEVGAPYGGSGVGGAGRGLDLRNFPAGVQILGNDIRGIRGGGPARAENPPVFPGSSGTSYGIIIVGAARPVVRGNTVADLVAADGGPGWVPPWEYASGGDDAGPGYGGAEAVGILVDSPSGQGVLTSNTVTNVFAGAGGAGGKGGYASWSGRDGGCGGDGGYGALAVGIRLCNASPPVHLRGNRVAHIQGGAGGNGGAGGGADAEFLGNGGDGGNGGIGSDGLAVLASNAEHTAQNDVLSNVQGGAGGAGGRAGYGYVDGSPGFGGPGGDGFGARLEDSSAAYDYNTFVDITDGPAGGAEAQAGQSAGFCAEGWATQVLSGNIVARANAGTAVGLLAANGASIQSDYNDIWGYTSNYDGVTAGPHDLSVDPGFVNWSAEDFHLGPSSPLIDVADPARTVRDDIDGQLRPNDIPQVGRDGTGTELDIGADEYWTPGQAGRIRVVFPADGETWTAGSTNWIEWAAGGDAGQSVRVALQQAGGGAEQVIASSIPISSLAFPWGIPVDAPPASDYQIVVESVEQAGVSGTSGAFSIVDPSDPRVLFPSDAGIVLEPGQAYSVTWSGFQGLNVGIELYRGAALNRTIAASTPNTGSFPWTVPADQAVGLDYRVKITDLDNPGQSDWSDNAFTISTPTVIYPSATGIGVWSGENLPIQWKGFAGASVNIELWQGGKLNRTIASGAPNDGSHDWVVPAGQLQADDYVVRIADASDARQFDCSDNPFVIGPLVIYPTASGIILDPNQMCRIQWISFPGPNVKIELYEGTALHRVIVDSTPNDGAYDWVIPSDQAVGWNYRVKITDLSDASRCAWSANVFAIDARLLWNGSSCTSVAFSPDGAQLLVAAWDRGVELRDATTGQLARTIGSGQEISRVASSPDGTLILTDGPNSTAELWDVSTGAIVRTLSGHTERIRCVAFSPDGSLVLTASEDGTVRLWKASTGDLARTFSCQLGGSPQSSAFSPDGTCILTGSLDKTAKLWSVSTGELVRTFTGHADSVNSVAFSLDGSAILTGSADKTAKLWDASTGALLRTFSRHTDVVESVAFSPYGPHALTADWRGAIRLVDPWTGNWVPLVSFEDSVYSLTFSPDGTRVAASAHHRAVVFHIGQIAPRLTSPTAPGVAWSVGQTYEIAWIGFDASDVRVELYKGTNLDRIIAASTPNDGSFPWTVPLDQTLGSDYRIKIADAANNLQYAWSVNRFEIQWPNLPNLTVDLPGNVPLRLARLPAGTFAMGSPDSERSRLASEGPVHPVSIGYDFYLGQCEVTQRQWRAVMGSNPSGGAGVGDDFPVYYVSWDGCQAFIRALNELNLGTFRLPSEAEWEYACRATTQTRFYFGDSLSAGDLAEDGPAGAMPGNRSNYMWYQFNRTPIDGTKSAGTKAPNLFGLYDMSGNVYEWCQDWSHSSYAGAPADGSPWETQEPGSSRRVYRGGGWGSEAMYCRSAFRDMAGPDRRYSSLGLRVARSTAWPRVTSPTGPGVAWTAGGTYAITWSGFEGSYVRIDLYKGSARNRVIASCPASAGSFLWTVPGDLAPGPDYRIKISYYYKPDTQYDFSDNAFSIATSGYGPPLLGEVSDAGAGDLRLQWVNANWPPAWFLGFAWDLYKSDWAETTADHSMWAVFGPAETSGTLRLGYSGAYHAWVAAQTPGGQFLPCANPWTGIVYSGAPHTPTGVSAEVLGDGRIRLHWKPDPYGVWTWRIVAWRDGVGWIEIAGPSGTGYWHFVDWAGLGFAPGTADFFAGWADFTPPAPGLYFLFIQGVGWLPPYPSGEFGGTAVSVAP